MLEIGIKEFVTAGPVQKIRAEIQDDPIIVQKLAIRLSQLKDVFKFYCDKKRRQFTYEYSALKMFQMDDSVNFQRVKMSLTE